MKVHYLDIEAQLKRVSRSAYDNGHAIDYVELSLLEASQIYDAMPHSPSREAKHEFLLRGFAVYAAPEMDLKLRWKGGGFRETT